MWWALEEGLVSPWPPGPGQALPSCRGHMGPAVKYRWGGWGPAGGDQPETPGHLGQDQGSGSWPLPLSSGPPWPTAASRGTDREGGPVPITSPHHSEEPSRGIQRGPVCSCFCVLRSSARPGGLGPGQDLRARGVRLCHAGWSFPVIPRDVATSPREAPGAGGGKGAGEWPWGGRTSAGKGREGARATRASHHSARTRRGPQHLAEPWGQLGKGRDSPQVVTGLRSHSWWDVLGGQRKLGKAFWGGDSSEPPGGDSRPCGHLRKDLGLASQDTLRGVSCPGEGTEEEVE